MADVMQFCQRGMVDYTFLSGAQIDPYGNLNSTVIGTHAKPKVRLPGSGGANDLASFCWRTLIVMKLDAKKFVEKLDFLTTPGYLTGPGSREAAGLPANTGPHRVITDLCVLDFHPETKRMRVKSLHPGKTLEQVKAATGFARWNRATCSAPPSNRTREQLHILRTEVDPGRCIFGTAVVNSESTARTYPNGNRPNCSPGINSDAAATVVRLPTESSEGWRRARIPGTRTETPFPHGTSGSRELQAACDKVVADQKLIRCQYARRSGPPQSEHAKTSHARSRRWGSSSLQRGSKQVKPDLR